MAGLPPVQSLAEISTPALATAPPEKGVDSDVRCNPVDSIGSSTESRVSHSEPRLLLGFQGTKTARRERKSSPFSDAGCCTSRQNSGGRRILSAGRQHTTARSHRVKRGTSILLRTLSEPLRNPLAPVWPLAGVFMQAQLGSRSWAIVLLERRGKSLGRFLLPDPLLQCRRSPRSQDLIALNSSRKVAGREHAGDEHKGSGVG
jgi:hypothetical protein